MNYSLKIPGELTQLLLTHIYRSLDEHEWSGRLEDGDVIYNRVVAGLRDYTSYILLEFFELVTHSAMFAITSNEELTYRAVRELFERSEFTHPENQVFDDFKANLNKEVDGEFIEGCTSEDGSHIAIACTILDIIRARSKDLYESVNGNENLMIAAFNMANAINDAGYVSFDAIELVDRLLVSGYRLDDSLPVDMLTLNDFHLAGEPINYSEKINKDDWGWWEIAEDWNWRIAPLSNLVGTWFVVENDETIYTRFNDLPKNPDGRYDIFTTIGDV